MLNHCDIIGAINARLNVLAVDTMPGILLTAGKTMPHSLPESVQAADIPGRERCYIETAPRYKLPSITAWVRRWAMGYGIDEKPATSQGIRVTP